MREMIAAVNAEAIGSVLVSAALNKVVPTLPLDDDVVALAARFERRLSLALSTALQDGSRSEAAKAMWADPAKRQRIAAAHNAAMQREATRAKLSAAGKRQWQDPEMRARLSAARRKQWSDPASRASIVVALRASAEAKRALKPRPAPIAEPKQPVVKAERHAAKAKPPVVKVQPPKPAKIVPKPKQRAALRGHVRGGWDHYVHSDFDATDVLDDIGLRPSWRGSDW